MPVGRSARTTRRLRSAISSSPLAGPAGSASRCGVRAGASRPSYSGADRGMHSPAVGYRPGAMAPAEKLEVHTGDGAGLSCELFLPGGTGPHPGVVVLHESFG